MLNGACNNIARNSRSQGKVNYVQYTAPKENKHFFGFGVNLLSVFQFCFISFFFASGQGRKTLNLYFLRIQQTVLFRCAKDICRHTATWTKCNVFTRSPVNSKVRCFISAEKWDKCFHVAPDYLVWFPPGQFLFLDLDPEEIISPICNWKYLWYYAPFLQV